MDRSTKEKLANIILGGDGAADRAYPKYRSGWGLTTFFSDAGLPQLKHDGETWRRGFVRDALDALNDDDISKVIQRLCLSREYSTTEQWSTAVRLVNEALEPEGLRAVTNASGRQVAVEKIDELTTVPETPNEPQEIKASTAHLSNNDVMVVHGRNTAARDAMFALLYAVKLQPIEWNDAVARAGGGSPYTGHIVKIAIQQAGAVVVLLTADDVARLASKFLQPGDGADERDLTGQARPNVILELGMALMADEDKTIIVELEPTRIITDLVGRNTIRFTDTPQSRHSILERLEQAGCAVKRTGDYWMSAGDFAVNPAATAPSTDSKVRGVSQTPAMQQHGGANSVNIQGGRDVNTGPQSDK